MSKQTSIFQCKGFSRTIKHQGQLIDISMQPPKKTKIIKCSYCDDTFKNNQGLSIHLKCKHSGEYVASKMESNPSKKICFKNSLKQECQERSVVKDVLGKLVDDVVKAEVEAKNVVNKTKKIGTKRKGKKVM